MILAFTFTILILLLPIHWSIYAMVRNERRRSQILNENRRLTYKSKFITSKNRAW